MKMIEAPRLKSHNEWQHAADRVRRTQPESDGVRGEDGRLRRFSDGFTVRRSIVS
jgi:hypothetical protein